MTNKKIYLAMEKHSPHTCSLDDFINEEIGEVGKMARESFDTLVAEKANKYDKASYHVTMPVFIHKSVAKKASQLGQSISDYISSIMARELNLAY